MSLRDPTSLRSTVPINLVRHLSTDTTMGAGMPVDSAIEVTPERLMQFTFGFAPPLIIEAAIRHGVFDALDQGAKTIENLCAETRTSPRGLRAILNALVGLELLAKDDKSGYALTAESATFLVRGKPSFHGAFFLLTSERMLSGWQKLHEIVRSGRPAMQVNREQDGVPFFLQLSKTSSRFTPPPPSGWAKRSAWRRPRGPCPCSTWAPGPACGASLSRSNHRTCA